jgi:hypothetical protein
MADSRLEKSWSVTRTLLSRAKDALPVPPSEARAEFEETLAEYERMLGHNELELALDALEHAGGLVLARGGFWKDLERAATNMELVARASQLRRRFQEALERNVGQNS